MPKKQYRLVKDGKNQLEIEWKSFWNKVTVRMNGTEIGFIPTRKELSQGHEIILPDNSVLLIKLHQGLNTELRVTRNGKPLPGSASDPQERWKSGYQMVLFLAGLNIVIGVAAEMFKVDLLLQLGIGLGSLIFGVVLLGLGLWAMNRSMIALILAAGIFLVDGFLSYILLAKQGVTPPSTGILVRIFLVLPILYGVPALWEINDHKIR